MTLEYANLERAATGPGGLFYGVYPALVSDVVDPNNQGRVKVRLHWSPDAGGSNYEVWARLATMMGGNNRGSWFIPDKDDEVLVAFEGHPIAPGHPHYNGRYRRRGETAPGNTWWSVDCAQRR